MRSTGESKSPCAPQLHGGVAQGEEEKAAAAIGWRWVVGSRRRCGPAGSAVRACALAMHPASRCNAQTLRKPPELVGGLLKADELAPLQGLRRRAVARQPAGAGRAAGWVHELPVAARSTPLRAACALEDGACLQPVDALKRRQEVLGEGG